MRELKFRAWDKKIKKLWEWEELQSLPMSAFKRKDLVWLRGSGKRDKNDKEYHEEDIVKYKWGGKEKIEKVVLGGYEDGEQYIDSFHTGWHTSDGYDKQKTLDDIEHIAEIIGNTQENPELLNK